MKSFIFTYLKNNYSINLYKSECCYIRCTLKVVKKRKIYKANLFILSKMEELIKILVVEDTEECRKAAQKYFSTLENVHVDFATTLEEALQKLQKEKYDIGIFDRNFPKSQGGTPLEFGFELGKKVEEKHNMVWAVITAGIDHHNCIAAFVHYFWDKEGKLHEITETPKTNPKAWQKVYETLLNPYKDKPIYWAAKRIYSKVPSKVMLMPIGKLIRKYGV